MPVDYNEQIRLSYLRAAGAAVEKQEDDVTLWREYYKGEQIVYLSPRQKEYLKNEVESFANICKRVVGIVADRLAIPEDGIQPVDDASTRYAEAVTDWWTDETTSDDGGNNDPYSLQSNVYEAALRDELTAVIVDWDAINKRPTFTPNLIIDGENTGLVRFHYDDSNTLKFAEKRWITSGNVDGKKNGLSRLNIYTPGYIERYESGAGNWRLMQPVELDGLPNPQPHTDNGTLSGEPLGIPVIPFENPTGSELQDVINIQDFINHNVSALDISVDLHGFPVLAFFGFNFPIDSNGYASIPKVGPDAAYSGDTDGSIQRVEGANLQMLFEAGVISWIQILALVKGWPMYLFDRNQQPPSGVALAIMEQALVSQIKRKQRAFSGSWRAAFNMGRKLHKLHTGEDLPGQIKFNWMPIEVKDPVAEADLLRAEFEAGQYPIITRWRRLGNTDKDIKQMLQDAAASNGFGNFDDKNTEVVQ